MKSRRRSQGKIPTILVWAVLSGSIAPHIHAQASQTADQRLRVTTFALGSYVRTNYTGPNPNQGITFGGEIDGFRLLPHTDIGLDVRETISHGDVSNQSLFEGGPRVSFNAYRLRPYVAYFVGLGRSQFKDTTTYPDYTKDETRTRGYDAGFDLRVTQYWSVRADAQRQRWRFSVRVPPFYPVEASVGVSYRLHIRGRHGPQY